MRFRAGAHTLGFQALPISEHTRMTTPHRPLRFIHRGQPKVLHHVPPDRTLLEVLREDL